MARSDLGGKVAFVTGVARPPGIGRAVALRLAQDGSDVVCVEAPPAGDPTTDSDAVEPGALASVAEEVRALGRRAVAIEADLGDEDAIRAAVAHAVDELGGIDVCCHLGGGTGPSLGTAALVELDEDAWDRCVQRNLVSPWLVARTCAAQMVAQGRGGAITLLASYAVRSTPEGYGAFSAARAGVVRLAEVMATELGPTGVRVNTVLPLGVAPGERPNPGLEHLARAAGASPDAWARRTIPMGRMQQAGETAAVFAFLSSDDASFVSGQAISVSGGAVR